MKKLATLFLVLGTLFPALAHALEVRPTYRIFVLKPGEKVNAELVLTSNEETDLNVNPESKDWKEYRTNKHIKAKDWLKTDETPFVLKPGESRTIKYSVTAPKKVNGEVMGMLSFATKAGESAPVSLRLSVAMYVVIEGTEKRAGEVAAIMVAPSSDTVVSYMFTNRGNVHLRPKGLIEIYNDKGELEVNAVFPQTVPTYPGKPHPYNTTIRNYRLKEGDYTAVIKLEDGDWNFSFPVQRKKFSVSASGGTKSR